MQSVWQGSAGKKPLEKVTDEKRGRTTEEDFKKFQRFCVKYIDYYSMWGDWSFYFLHEETKEDILATATYDLTSRNVTITLEKDWSPIEINDKGLEENAHHEIVELMLADFKAACQDAQQFSQNRCFAEAHKIVNKLWERAGGNKGTGNLSLLSRDATENTDGS